jgi:SAM-dependent methyltransferase
VTAQKEAYKASLGDNWLRRNKKDLGVNQDPVEALFNARVPSTIKKVLEVGCSNGWRLKRLKEKGYDVYGIDPSAEGIFEARRDVGDNFAVGTADNMLWPDGYFDCVIMGFCLWAMAPEDWLPAVAESDRVLRDGGYLIIHDRFSSRPMRRPYPYGDMEGMYQYSYDWKKLWLAHPAYTEAAEALGVHPRSTSIEGAVMLQKDVYSRILNGEN